MNLIKHENFVANQWLAQGNGNHLAVVDKFNGKELSKLPLATEDQMEQAIAASVIAFEEMKTWSAGKRAEKLWTLRSKIEERAEELAQLIMKEAGKPISYARNEIARCITTVETAATEVVRFTGEMVPLDFGAGEGKTAFTKRYPMGPVACITPFNFPLNLVLHKVAPAIAVGSPVVVKPAPQSPLSTYALAALMEEVGFPAGAMNVLVCDIPIAEKLVRDERMAMLSFTGSEMVGWHLKNIAGRKKVTLELGGNASVIIDESADLKDAAKKVAVGSFIYAGQICISTQRIFVVEKVFEEFKNLLISEVGKLKTGDPSDDKVLVGPIIDTGHVDRIDSWVKEAVSAGAELLCGGGIISRENNTYAPTLITNTDNSMKVACAEAFGPIAILERVDDFEDGIRKTNDSNFGLQAGLFTNDFSNVKLSHELLEVGGIMVNNIPGFRIDSMPYGGIKGSGLGREGIKYAMEDMTEMRLMVY
jgi:acyl-CoA reductase-like NAD-dependent aldehyde dehydrogenase